ncbi:hypothetical protein EIH16_01920 [Mesomycoplasma hyorhinis]|nr:hypothetical protein EIH16_01920 [Mesomycoplasma hyorhinis]
MNMPINIIFRYFKNPGSYQGIILFFCNYTNYFLFINSSNVFLTILLCFKSIWTCVADKIWSLRIWLEFWFKLEVSKFFISNASFSSIFYYLTAFEKIVFLKSKWSILLIILFVFFLNGLHLDYQCLILDYKICLIFLTRSKKFWQKSSEKAIQESFTCFISKFFGFCSFFFLSNDLMLLLFS